MVTMINNWYVYEPGDRVYSLAHGRSGTVREIKRLNLSNKEQLVAVQLRGKKDLVDIRTSDLELKERVNSSIFYRTDAED